MSRAVWERWYLNYLRGWSADPLALNSSTPWPLAATSDGILAEDVLTTRVKAAFEDVAEYVVIQRTTLSLARFDQRWPDISRVLGNERRLQDNCIDI